MALDRLSPQEVRDLTGPRVRRRQLENLRQNGIRHTVDAHGRPCVLRDALQPVAPEAAPVPAWRPRKAVNG